MSFDLLSDHKRYSRYARQVFYVTVYCLACTESTSHSCEHNVSWLDTIFACYLLNIPKEIFQSRLYLLKYFAHVFTLCIFMFYFEFRRFQNNIYVSSARQIETYYGNRTFESQIWSNSCATRRRMCPFDNTEMTVVNVPRVWNTIRREYR